VALAPFFDRVFSAVGGHLSVSRDDLTRSLQDVKVGITCGPTLSRNDLWIAELSTNLLARLYPSIALVGDEATVEHLSYLAKCINPDIEWTPCASPEYTIGIATDTPGVSLFPSASGWVSRLNHYWKIGSGPENPYSSGAAACFASSELFRRVFIGTGVERDISVSLLNFDEQTGVDLELSRTPLGEVLFVAVGAVGNGAIWALSRDSQRPSQLTVLDAELLELSNLQRYVLGRIEDVGRLKVDMVKDAFEQSNAQIEAFPERLEQYADRTGGINANALCISVDNVMSRRAAQALLPRIIVNGWTGEQSLGASSHVFSEGACLACLYHPHRVGTSQTDQAAKALGLTPSRAAELWVTRVPLSEDDIIHAAQKLGVSAAALTPWKGKQLGDLYTDVVCGAVPIDLPVAHRVETVPLSHQSALAGVLMAAELVKRTTELRELAQKEVLVSWENILREPPKIWAIPRAQENNCICSDADFQEQYANKWKRPKFEPRPANSP